MLDLEGIKQHLRIELEDNEEDDYLQSLIDAAIAKVENDTEYRCSAALLELWLPDFKSEIVLPVCPVASIKLIEYTDVNGIVQVLAESDYHLDNKSLKAVLKPAYGQSFPSVLPGYESVKIEYNVGATQWPKPIKQAVAMLAGHWYSNRETVVTGTITSELPQAYKSLIQPYRVPF